MRRSAASPARVPLGPDDLDRRLGGGLSRGALHEVLPGSAGDIGAATGFAMGLAARAAATGAARAVFHIQQEVTALEAGWLYAAGLDGFGLDPRWLVSIALSRRADLLLAMEEALRCPGIAAVIGELVGERRPLGLTASRRLALAAEAGGGLGVLLRPPDVTEPGAAATRWLIRAAASEGDRFGGLGPTRLRAGLVRSRLGETGEWRIEWRPHERVFAEAAVSRPVAAAPSDRQDRAAQAVRRHGTG